MPLTAAEQTLASTGLFMAKDGRGGNRNLQPARTSQSRRSTLAGGRLESRRNSRQECLRYRVGGRVGHRRTAACGGTEADWKVGETADRNVCATELAAASAI